MIKKIIKRLIPRKCFLLYKILTFDDSIIIYKGVSFRKFLNDSMKEFKPNIDGDERRKLIRDIIKVFLEDGTRPDEYLLYHYDKMTQQQRSEYMPRSLKDSVVLKYYQSDGKDRISLLRDKYEFYSNLKPFFKREVIKIVEDKDYYQFHEFCKKHDGFIAKEIEGRCGVGVQVIKINDKTQIKAIFNDLIAKNSWVIEELIVQNKEISLFNSSSINTVRFPSFKHANKVVAAYPCMRFGRKGSIVDNAGQGGVFVSIDINTGEIITDGYDEYGHKYKCHPDSNVEFKGFKIPEWSSIKEFAHNAHLSLPKEQTYVAFDFALSDRGWCIVEGNWGDFILQQVSLGKGLKKEFLSLLNG